MNLRPYTRLNSQNPPYPREAVFQKLQRSQTQSSQNKTYLIFSHVWVEIPGFRSLDYNLQPIDQFPGKWYPILDINSLIYIPYPRVNCLKTIPFTAAHTYIAHTWHYPPPPPGRIHSAQPLTWWFSIILGFESGELWFSLEQNISLNTSLLAHLWSGKAFRPKHFFV